MANSATLTPENSRVLFNGIPMAFGRAPGTYATFAPVVAERTTMSVGVDGPGYYTRTGNRAYTLRLVVLPTSEENDILAAALILQEAAPNGLVWPLVVMRGLATYVGTCVIAGEPPLVYSDGPVTNEWLLNSVRMVGKQGGMPASPLGPT
jgi:hypothetical protein